MDKPMKRNVALDVTEMAVVLDALRRHKEAIEEERKEYSFLAIIYDEIESYIDSAERKIRKVFEKLLTTTTEK